MSPTPIPHKLAVIRSVFEYELEQAGEHDIRAAGHGRVVVLWGNALMPVPREAGMRNTCQ
jgi:hypothetical protein